MLPVLEWRQANYPGLVSLCVKRGLKQSLPTVVVRMEEIILRHLTLCLLPTRQQWIANMLSLWHYSKWLTNIFVLSSQQPCEVEIFAFIIITRKLSQREVKSPRVTWRVRSWASVLSFPAGAVASPQIQWLNHHKRSWGQKSQKGWQGWRLGSLPFPVSRSHRNSFITSISASASVPCIGSTEYQPLDPQGSPCKLSLPCKVTYSQVPEIRTWTSLGWGHYSVYNTGLEVRRTKLRAGIVNHTYVWPLTGPGEEGERW